MSKKLTVAVTTCLFVMGNTESVRAQETVQPAASRSDTLEEVVITARRKEEKLQSVPIAVTAFSQSDITEKRIQSATDLKDYVPSLNFVPGQGTTFNIRGLGGASGSSGGSPVQTYFDEVPDLVPTGAATTNQQGRFFDLENLQVLKGPQGTLFGRTALGGAILFELKKPTDNFEGYWDQILGDYNWHEEQIALNVPVIEDKLLLRGAIDFNNRDGYTHDITHNVYMDDIGYKSWRVSVTMRPTDDIQNDFVYSGGENNSRGYGYTLFATDINALGTIALPGLGTVPIWQLLLPNFNTLLPAAQALGPRAVALPAAIPNPLNNSYSYEFVDTARWDVNDNLTLRNIFGYQVLKSRSVGSQLSPVPINIISTVSGWGAEWASDLGQITDEPQIQGKAFDDHLTYTVGGFYEYNHPEGHFESDSYQNLGGTKLTGTASTVQSSTRAVYGQGTYDLGGLLPALDGLSLTAGYRYTWDRLSSTNFNYIISPTGVRTCQTAGQTYPCAQPSSTTSSGKGWSVGLDYKLVPETLVYVRSGHSYKPGNANGLSTQSQFQTYGPESVTDVELGVKSDWEIFGVKGRANADIYHDWYSNVVLFSYLPINGTLQGVSTNGGDAILEGVELEYTILPFKDFELSGYWSYNHSQYEHSHSPLFGDVAGRPFVNDPMNKFALTGRYHVPIDESYGEVSTSVTYTWQSHQYFSADPVEAAVGDPAIEEGNIGLLNLRMDWNNIMGRSVDLSFFMNNVTDQLYRAYSVSSLAVFGFSNASYAEPRMFGVELRYRFGPGQNSGLNF